MFPLLIIGLVSLSIFCFIVATDPYKSGKARLFPTLLFAIPIPIIIVMIGAYLS